MEQFMVSARKYRPTRFDEVIGQAHISETFKNALAKKHLGHSFLFCGPRGVGKTTCARILAKTLNCTDLQTDIEACGVCSSCQSFEHATSLNIYELDAASNNSVEDIRQLTEQVRYAPQSGKYKIYIIDEVHMLSTQAFNAFLKTLEEPPAYAKFILATTEKQKIIPTILSRCQIFDFKRIGVNDIVQYLNQICIKENITADQQALHLIAQKADGALRDALSLFDRLLSASGQTLVYEEVLEHLNVLDYEYFFKATEAILSKDTSTLLLLIDTIYKNGFEGDIFLEGLASHFRNLFLLQSSETYPILECSDVLLDRYKEQAKWSDISFLVNALNIASACMVEYKMAKNKRLLVELACLKMCYISDAFIQKNHKEKKKKHKESIEIPVAKETTANADIESASIPQDIVKSSKAQNKFDLTPSISNQIRITSLEKITEEVIDHTHKKSSTETKEGFEKDKNTLNQSTEKKDIEVIKSDSLTDFKKIWKVFLDYLEAQSHLGLTSILKTISVPVIQLKKNNIQLKVHSITQKKMVESNITILKDFLSKKYDIKQVQIQINVETNKKEKTSNNKSLIGDKEKIYKMIDKNPSLSDLINQMNLKIER